MRPDEETKRKPPTVSLRLGAKGPMLESVMVLIEAIDDEQKVAMLLTPAEASALAEKLRAIADEAVERSVGR